MSSCLDDQPLDGNHFVFSFPKLWRPVAVDGGGSERDPLVFAQVPRGPHRSPLAPAPRSPAPPPDAAADAIVTITASGILGVHTW